MVLVKNDCHKVHRGNDWAFGEAFYRCSNLAKARGKGYGGLGYQVGTNIHGLTADTRIFNKSHNDKL